MESQTLAPMDVRAKSYESLQSHNSLTSEAKHELVSFIFPDCRALYKLHIDRCRELNYSEIQLEGFDIYIVEQWAAVRKLSTLITTYTGNSQDSIFAVRVLLPREPSLWPPEFKAYHDQLLKFCKPMVRDKGIVFVTELSTIPSNLNILHVDTGDQREAWKNFKVNYDLKRLHCGGRSALLLRGPSSAAVGKFAQLFKISMDHFPQDSAPGSSDTTPQNGAADSSHHNDKKTLGQALHLVKMASHYDQHMYCPVAELITLVQISLNYFNMFEGCPYKDGLLCEETKKAIENWWDSYGKIYLGIEKPKNEAILGPTTVASLFSFVLCCFFKLMLEDCISSKDPFDEEEFFTGIYTFQKKYNLVREEERTYLDLLTIQKLFAVTNKETNRDLFKFHKVVKSAVHDIKGNGNFRQLSNDVLTTDLDNLIKNVHCGSLGWLWKTKNGKRDNSYLWKRNEFANFTYENGDLETELEKQTALCKQRRELKEELKKQKKESDIIFVEEREWIDDEKIPDIPQVTEIASSNESISSMLCNYDVGKFMRMNDTNQSYRNEYFRRNSFPFMKAETYPKYHTFAVGYEPLTSVRHRAGSISCIQDGLEVWDLPFDSSAVKIARDIMRTERLEDPNGPQLESFSENVIEEDICYEDEELMRECSKFSDKFKSILQEHKTYYSNLKTLDDAKWKVGHDQALLENDMEEINSLSSKLAYNVKVLERRVRDVERSINRFQDKISTVQDSILEGGCGIKDSLFATCDEKELQEIILGMMNKEKTKYQALCLKVISMEVFSQFKDDLMGWCKWLFGEFSFHKGIKKNAND